MSDDSPWNEHYHCSSFLDTIEDNISSVYLHNLFEPFTTHVSIHKIDFENNLLNIKDTIPLDILIKPGIVKNLYIGEFFSSTKIDIYRTLLHYSRYVFS